MTNLSTYPVIVTSPTAGGNTACVQQLVSMLGACEDPPTVTTRPPRAHLDAACDIGYFHVTQRLFSALLCADALKEYSVTNLYSYGTPHAVNVSGKCLLLFALDADGATRFKDTCRCTVIGLVPAGKEVIQRRIDARGDANPELLAERLDEALYDIKQISKISDFTVISADNNWDETIQELEQIIRVCALRTGGRKLELQEILRSFDF